MVLIQMYSPFFDGKMQNCADYSKIGWGRFGIVICMQEEESLQPFVGLPHANTGFLHTYSIYISATEQT
jgi:hypothetical protein